MRLREGSKRSGVPGPGRSPSGRSSWAAVGRAAIGPAAIVTVVLVVMHDLAFGARLPSQHPDIPDFWLPTYCFLGRSLAAGHIPGWNPFVLGGLPFASDPQSGWMSVLPMALFTAFPCAAALRWMIVLQPILGGLGLYWFLRTEGLSRPAATAGGVALSGFLAGSRLGLFLPFPAAFAWTAVTLAAASKLFRAERSSTALLWAALTALAWGQLAAAHFAHGAVIGTLALAAFVAAKASAERVRARRRSILARAVLLLPLMVALNLAFLVPRLAYLPVTSYGPGYASLAPLEGLRGPAWPLALGAAPGGYLGTVALVLAGAAFWSRRHRSAAVGFGILGGLGYLLGLDAVARALEPVARGVPGLDFYVHYPGRLSLALVLVLPILAAIGAEAWGETTRRRPAPISAALLAPGTLLWVAGPVVVGMGRAEAVFLAVAVAATAVAITLAIAAPRGAWALPAALAGLLIWSGLAGLPVASLEQTRASPVDRLGPPGWLTQYLEPGLDAEAYLAPDPIVRALRAAGPVRYTTVPRPTELGPAYLAPLTERYWGLETNQRAMLFEIEDAQGYNPVQLGRVWRLVRAVTDGPFPYNVSLFDRLEPSILDIFQVGFVIDATVRIPEPGAVPVASSGEWTLYRRPRVPPRAWAVTSWAVVRSEEDALATVTDPGFDPTALAVLEESDRPPAGSTGPGSNEPVPASFEPLGLQAARVDVEVASPSIVVISTPFAPGWRAEVDGRPAPLLHTDYAMQGVAVPAGRHTIGLSYDDPWIGYGLLGSVLAMVGVGGSVWIVRRREGRTRPP